MIGRPTVEVPPWPQLEDAVDEVNFPYYSPRSGQEIVAALWPYLPSNQPDHDSNLEPDAYSCDHFRMYEFKVRRCPRGRSHDWTECPYAHAGEKARRRDPRKFHYSSTSCPDFRKGNCRKGDACEYAHGVFECWLHPARYRTQPCKDGVNCRRRVCFFAHTPEQLRPISHPGPSPRGASPSDFYDFSSLKATALASPSSASPEDSPPVSPMTAQSAQLLSRSLGSSPINDVVASLRSLQLNKLNKLNPSSSSSWVGFSGGGSPLGPTFRSVPTTPTRVVYSDLPEDPPMERVESGRDLRARMFEKLSKDNSLYRGDHEQPPSDGVGGPDVGWVWELVK